MDVTIIRHYKLQYPYDNWKNLTFEQYKNFAEAKSDPDISEEPIVEFSLQTSPDIILTSKTSRTFETATKISQFLNLRVPIQQTESLDEIPQIIEDQVTEQAFSMMKKNNKRTFIASRQLNPHRILQQILTLENELAQLKQTDISSILCISHSYFIGALNLYFNIGIKDWITVTNENIQTAEIPGYLTGFTVTI